MHGQVGWLGFLAVLPGEQTASGFCGNARELQAATRALKVMQSEVDAAYRAQLSGSPDYTKGADYHEFNLATDPGNYDFLIWLIDAEMTRRREKAPWPLRVGFSHEDALNERGRKFWEAVHRPLLSLVGAVEDARAIGGFRNALFTPSQVCLAARRGEEVPVLEASAEARTHVAAWLHGRRRPVTITLREASHQWERNSDVASWLRFAQDLRSKGELVVFVRDTERANEPIADFVTYPQASFHVQSRMALYELARANLFVSNGPAGLGLFSRAPYLYFIQLKDGGTDSGEWWTTFNGISESQQWPWARPDQRMIWQRDTYSNLCAAWEDLAPLLR